jgi:Ser/Thr protein kinase RdoA (MazF antagonist)
LTEIPLVGGTANRGLVVRRGNTVRRPLRPTSAATHALLRHLEQVGFDGAPRLLGLDAEGREVLSFIAGEAPTPPYPAWALTDDALASVARLLRRYHEAVADFDGSVYTWADIAPARFHEGLTCHNDVNLDNVVFRSGRAVALIDFDLAGPGSATWDVAGAVRLWAPLRPDAYILDARHGRALHRLKLFVHGYGPPRPDPEELVEAVRQHHERLYRLVEEGAREGNAGFADYWQEAEQRASAAAAWFAVAADDLVRALTEP